MNNNLNHKIEWQSLLPNTASYQTIFADASKLAPANFALTQPRLANAIELFCNPNNHCRFMLVRAPDTHEYLKIIADAIRPKFSAQKVSHSYYLIQDDTISMLSTENSDGPFAAKGECLYQEWFESEQLFGCARFYQGKISLQPGLVHKANGGILVLSSRTLLAQPLLWLRLKQMIKQGSFYWSAPDENRPFPVTIPAMPLALRIVIVGERTSLADFYDIEPELCESAIYSEYENELSLNEQQDIVNWCRYVNNIILQHKLPPLTPDAWPQLMIQAIRYSGDQYTLPLSPLWLTQYLSEAALYEEGKQLSTAAIDTAVSSRIWHENYLAQKLQDDIASGQILIETQGEIVGQINGLSVLEYPGHPRIFGEPTRISCVVHFGDGELTDVERKAELGGNLHAKGMMIMQAFLVSELALEQQLPFSASIVFEQSYSEVDGDSASLAELCALISALAQLPITQQIAVTGSVDQFGNVQPIGGINEKIEGFFEVCQHHGLTGKQGVILPMSNMRHLCLHSNVIDAVRDGMFHLWAIDHASQAFPLLMGYRYSDDKEINILQIIQSRIIQATAQERQRSWPLRWLNWFNHN